MELNQGNICKHLKPTEQEILSTEDSFKKIFELQANLQEKVGRASVARSSNMQQKCLMIQEEMFNLNRELGEMMDRLPFKHWKKYSPEMLKDWIDEDQRIETIFEFIDAFHFFLNIAIILEFQPEEIISYYIAKNKENFRRNESGY